MVAKRDKKPSISAECRARMTIRKIHDEKFLISAKRCRIHSHSLAVSDASKITTVVDEAIKTQCLLPFKSVAIRDAIPLVLKKEEPWLSTYQLLLASRQAVENRKRKLDVGEGTMDLVKDLEKDLFACTELLKSKQISYRASWEQLSTAEDPKDPPIPGKLTLVFASTDGMRSLEHYGQLVLMDSTFCTSKPNFPIYTLLVNDSYGCWIVGAQIISEGENTDPLVWSFYQLRHMMRHIEILEPWVPQYVLIDRSPTETAAIRTVFPSTTIFYCRFHVIQILQNKLSSFTNSFEAMERAVYSKTEDECMAHVQASIAACPEDTHRAYIQNYWGRNWLFKSWSDCGRQSHPLLMMVRHSFYLL